MMKSALDLSKIERFDGSNFKRWSEDILFYLETMNLEYVLYVDGPAVTVSVNDVTPTAVETVEKSDVDKRDYVKDNRTCRRYLLHYLSNSLFEIYYPYESAKKIWEALKSKYAVENSRLKKYVAEKILDFKMQDGKSVIDQVHTYQTIVGGSHWGRNENMQEFSSCCTYRKITTLVERL